MEDYPVFQRYGARSQFGLFYHVEGHHWQNLLPKFATPIYKLPYVHKTPRKKILFNKQSHKCPDDAALKPYCQSEDRMAVRTDSKGYPKNCAPQSQP
jgi:hypothetical protein